MEYSTVDLKYIKYEFESLLTARQEAISRNVIDEWITSFAQDEFPAENVCRMIRKVKGLKVYGKLKYSDFLDCLESTYGMENIIPIKLLPVKTETVDEKEIEKTQSLIYRVRHELGLSFADFLHEADVKGYTPDEWFEQLKADPKLTGCTRLEDKAREQRKITTLAEAIKNNF